VQGSAVWQVNVDSAQLESALLNLAINARDAMPGGGRLTFETHNATVDETYGEQYDDLTPGDYVLISVSDTGTGMSPETMARAFEPFFTTKEVGKGTGLGLAMVYGFVKQSGGHIKVYSELAHGTSFKIYLPRWISAGLAAAEAKLPQDAHEPRGTETILLVEDDPLVRGHVEGLLRVLGYRVLVACNGSEGLKVLAEHDDIDLLFTDVVMPGGMGGRELAEQAAALRPSLRILFTSGYAENAIVHHGRLQPGLHLLRKPYRRRELAMKLRELLDTAASAKAPGGSRSQ
jgi:CheY-like chemotaxis protein